jgi:DNA polymerase V
MINPDQENYSVRLQAIMAAKGWTQVKLAEMLGMAVQNLNKYLLPEGAPGRRDPENLSSKLIKLGVSIDWLYTGNGAMFLEDVQHKSVEEFEIEEALRSQARVIQLMFDRGLVTIPPANRQTEIKSEQKVCCPCEDCYEVPHYIHRVAAGPPTDSTCQAEKISLPTILVKHPNDTYAVTVSGDSMKGAGIEEGDILIVDRAIEPANKSIVIASINGEQTVKRLQMKKGTVSLMPENHKYPEIPITTEMDFRTLGVVTWVIRRTL